MKPTPPPAPSPTPQDAVFEVILVILERALDLAAGADRAERLAELARLGCDLDLFIRAVWRMEAYVSKRG